MESNATMRGFLDYSIFHDIRNGNKKMNSLQIPRLTKCFTVTYPKDKNFGLLRS